jgi:glycosyltransferase involved in cell wall biosynthesis
MRDKKPKVLITLDSMKDPNTGFFYFAKALSAAIIKLNNNRFNLSFYVKKTAFDDGRKLLQLRKFHKYFWPFRYSFDLVHITDQFCRVQPEKVNGKTVLTVHDLNQLHQPGISQEEKTASIATLNKHFKASDKIVAISNFVANDIKVNFPDSKDKISVIYNGADKLLVDDEHEPAYLPKKKFLFTLGPLNEKKNFHVLPALLVGNDYELVISGITPTPTYTDLLWAKAKAFGCEDRVTLTGIISDADKAWYYKNCDAFLFPSLAEGFGLPVIEAMYFGKPVFLSNKTSLPEIGGNCAFYFNNFEPGYMQQVFNDGMHNYIKNFMEPDIMAHAQTFNWDNTAAQYIQLYKDLLDSK